MKSTRFGRHLTPKTLMRSAGIGAMIGFFTIISGAPSQATAAEYHVAMNGDDNARGTASEPFRTIQRAADAAQPGDVITVHEGVYRERVNPPRGGESDTKRITYQAAPGEKVEIKGSEIVKNWRKVRDGVWEGVVHNSIFGDFNPYTDKIHGDWFDPKGREHHTGAVYIDGRWVDEAASLIDVLEPKGDEPLWFAMAATFNTTIWAWLGDVDPNQSTVEINVRQTVFYPDKPGVNYITVSGFTMRHAATPWSPPTAEQIGLIGTHWSKGWVIENNVISHSRCSGITLGKYGDEWDNRCMSAEGYIGTIQRALKNGWNRETIGHHIVRNNTISDCEQAGICGSLGAAFSRITGNHIHHIWFKRKFKGAEMGGIKLHAAIDTLIDNNRVHHAGRGIWMDWMAQGTRISANLCYENIQQDLFMEVDHGPFLVDNNIFLSKTSLLDASQGGAFVHNLFVGKIINHPDTRTTPFHEPHSTSIAGFADIRGGDDRFYNNIFIGVGKNHSPAMHGWGQGKRRDPAGYGLWMYDDREYPLQTGGNVYYNGAKPYANESRGLVVDDDFAPTVQLQEKDSNVYLLLNLGQDATKLDTTLVTTSLLGKAKIPDQSYTYPDGSPVTVDRDYFSKPRNADQPSPGPFEEIQDGTMNIEVWNAKRKLE